MKRLLLFFLIVKTCGAVKATYSAPDGDNFVLVNGKMEFQLGYNKTDGKKGFEEGVAHLSVPANAAATAETKDNSTTLFNLSWGTGQMKTKLTFIMEAKDNKTSLNDFHLDTFQTAEFGFEEPAEEGAEVQVSFRVQDFAWDSAGSFACDAKSELSDSRDNFTLAMFRVQVAKAKTFQSKGLQHCSADMKTTTMAPKTTTTTAPPAPVSTYAVKDRSGHFCILLKAGVLFDVTYEAHNKTNTTISKTVHLEIPKNAVHVNGKCDLKNNTEQSITLSFNDTWTMELFFSDSHMYTKATDGKSYTAYQMKLKGTLPKDAVNQTLDVMNLVDDKGNGALTNFLLGSYNKSVSCGEYSEKLTAQSNSTKPTVVTVRLVDVRFEAFAEAVNTTDFSESANCVAPAGGSDLIPIIVGACLAALVVIVLIAYLIGRARARRGGYQSV